MNLRPAFLSLLLAAAAGPSIAAPAGAVSAGPVAAVRVSATDQAWDFFHPWTKHTPYSRRGLGAVISGGRILVAAELVANANYIELERAETGEKVPATVLVADYECNLALIRPQDPKFLDGIIPLELTAGAVGDHLEVWQLETTGALLTTDALLTTAAVARYPLEDMALLQYSFTSSLQYRDGSFTLPVVKQGRLAALLFRYDARTQNADAIPEPVIRHFLDDAGQKEYAGFPKAGLLYCGARDPQLRQFAKIPPLVAGGVYITHVERDSPAEEAGITQGDVLLAVAGQAVDQDGNYADPDYGKLNLISVIALQKTGSSVPFKLLRDGKPLTVNVTMRHKAAESYVIPPYMIDKPPRFYVAGGLVLTEMTRQYLKEWGADWAKKAPERLVYYDRYQNELFHGGRKGLVILSQVLPTADTIGYEELSGLLVTKINDTPLSSIADVPGALAHPVDGFHKIEFEGNPKVIYLDAAQVAGDTESLKAAYGLPILSRMQ